MRYVSSILTGKNATIETKAFGPDMCTIIVTAADLQEAAELVKQNESATLEACRNWKPEETPPVKEETPEEDPAEAERAARLAKTIKNARAFTKKKDAGSITFGMMRALADLVGQSMWNGILDCYSLGFRRGYNKAKKEQRRN